MKKRPAESSSLAATALVAAPGLVALVVVVLAMLGGAPLAPALLALIGVLACGCCIALARLRSAGIARAHAEQQLAALRAGTELRSAWRAEIGRREDAQRALALSEQRLSDIIAAMPVPLILKDSESRILLMNRAAEEQSSMPFAEVRGTSASSWFPPEQIASSLAQERAAFGAGRMMVYESPIWSSGRQENRIFQIFKKPVFNDGKPQLLICMYIDVTERKRAEDKLQRSLTQLRQLGAYLATSKEEERRRLAADIHDDLGQNLMALKIDVQMLHARAGARHPNLKRQVGRVLDTLDTTIRSVRAIMNELHPSTLELGLPAALEWLVLQFEQRSGLACTLSVSGSGGALLDSARNAAIFRIVQEALLNIVRHAEAMQVEVALKMDARGVAITIVDDGCGMRPGEAGRDAAFGLRSIRERVDAFGGELLIESRRGSRRSSGRRGNGRRGNGSTMSIMIPAASELALAEHEGK
jgi:two-component system sensor histidine kinase UhpB